MSKKALVLASVASMIDQFNMPNIRLLKELGYEVDVACNFVKGSTCSDEKVAALKKTLAEMGVQCYQIDFARNVLYIIQNIKAYYQTKQIIKEGKYDLIHSHSPIGGLLSRLAARKQRESGTKVIYTAHGFHFYKGAPLLNWLLFYPIEKIASRWTDVLITINQEDFAFAKKKMKAKEVIYVPGVGIDVRKFSPHILSEKTRLEKRAGLGLKEGEKMLLSVGELIPRKNHIEVIRALALLEDQNWQYFICGKGERKEELGRMAEQLGVSEKIHFLGFRTDISELCNCCDLYVFPSLQEGLPVALMEAIASKVPVICSSIRGNVDLVQDSATFDTDNPQELALKIHQYLNKDNSSEIEANYKHLLNFDLNKVSDYMKELYGGGYNALIRCYLRYSFGLSDEDILVLSVGELNRNKNHEKIIRAIAKLNREDIHYAIAGKGVLKDELERLANSLRIRNQLHLLGFRKDIDLLYKAADIYAHPSIREGLSVALMEAMASGLPVVCSEIRGNTDLIESGKGGFLFEPENEVSAYWAMNQIVSSDELKLLGIFNKEKAKSLDVKVIMDKMRAIYS